MKTESDHLMQLIQKGFHLTVGATMTLIDALQEPQQLGENLSKLGLELAQKWTEKGEVTEQEARNLVENIFTKSTHPQTEETAVSPPVSTESSTAPEKLDLQGSLQELTAQITAIRAELEKIQDVESSE